MDFRIHVLAEVMDACMLLQEEDTGQKRDGVHAKHWERLFFNELLQHVCGGIHYLFLCSLSPVPAPDAPAKKLNVSHHQVAMGKRADAKQEPKKGVRKEGKGEKKEVAWVPKFRFFAKESLRSYPDTDGVCVFVRKGEDERKFFRLASILKVRSSQNDELCKRIGMGLALDVATVNHALRVLTKHFGDAMQEDVAKQLKKTGVPGLLAALATQEGKDFMTALTTLDVGQTKKPAEKDVKKALKVFREYLEREDKDFHRSLTLLASQSVALYLGAMALLKDLSFFQDPKGWISKVEGKQKDDVRAWQKSPSDKKKMDKALLVEFMKKVQDNEPDKDKKRKASDSSSEASAAPARKARSSSGAASSGSGVASCGSDSSAESAAESDSDKSSTNGKNDKNKDAKKKEKKAQDKSKEKPKREQKEAKRELEKRQKREAAKEKAAKKNMREEERNREKDQKAVPQVTLALNDASDEEEAEGESPYADWPQPNRVVFVAAVQDAQLAQKATSKSDKLTLSGLVSVMDNIEAILKHHQLEDVLKTLKKMERMPRMEKVEMILASLQALADAANAKPVLAEMAQETKTPTEEAPEETEAPEDKDANKEKGDEAKKAEQADEQETWASDALGWCCRGWLKPRSPNKKNIFLNAYLLN